MAIFREGLERCGVRLVLEIPADLPPLIAVQSDIEQLLLNLLSNARDATRPDDHVAIRASVIGGSLELVVEDTGCGISPEQLARIQEPFFTTKSNGHGLGLAICRSIVAQLRGQFQIESTPEREPACGRSSRVRKGVDHDHRATGCIHPDRR